MGATENIILASATAKGRTVIHNAAREPEIVDLQDFINKAGGKIKGAGTDRVIIDGVDSLCGTEHTVIPDRIVVATYLAAAAVTQGDILLKCVNPEHLTSLISCFNDMGCNLNIYDDVCTQ